MIKLIQNPSKVNTSNSQNKEEPKDHVSSPINYGNSDLQISENPTHNQKFEMDDTLKYMLGQHAEERKVLLDKYSERKTNAYDDKQEANLKHDDTEDLGVILENNYSIN